MTRSRTVSEPRRGRAAIVLRCWLVLGLLALIAFAVTLSHRTPTYVAVAHLRASAPGQLVAATPADILERTHALLRPASFAGAERPVLTLRIDREDAAYRVRASAREAQFAADAADTAADLLRLGSGARLQPAQVPPLPRPDAVWLGLAAIPLIGLPLVLLWRTRRSARDRAPAPAGADATYRAPAAGAEPGRRALRTDIEGLRAVAVSVVVLWHAGVSWLPGGFTGVDMFFVISGFLMSGVLLGQIARDGRVRLGNFYARRARRLLPAALTAQVGIAVLTLAFLPRPRWAGVGSDVVAAAAYVVNWRMASNAVDYLQVDWLPSPVQHFWSLSVEEQFYLAWPVVVLLGALLASRLRIPARRIVLVISLLVFVASLAISVRWTQSTPTTAYYVTPTRVWELALGSVIACTPAVWRRLPRPLVTPLAWAGAVLVVAAMFTIHPGDPFPGWRALIPTVGVALLIALAPECGRRGPYAVLALPALQRIGGLSYSIYLWHWPFIVTAMALTTGSGTVAVQTGLLAAALSLIPAWLSYRFIEEPLRRNGIRLPSVRRDRASLYLGLTNSLAAACCGVFLLALAWPASWVGSPVRWSVPPAVLAARPATGAAVLGADPAASPQGVAIDDPGRTTPLLERVVWDTGTVDSRHPCTVATYAVSEPVECPAGDPHGTRLLVVVGDSHARQWLPALDQIGRSQGWRVIALTKSSCPPIRGLTLPGNGSASGFGQCAQWNQAVTEKIAALRPEVIVAGWSSYAVDTQRFTDATRRALTAYRERTGARVVVIRDAPKPTANMSECLLAHPRQQTRCAFDRAEGLARNGLGQEQLFHRDPAIGRIDLTDWICPRPTCAPVIGGVVVYRDTNHLTETYARSLTPLLAARLKLDDD